MNYNIVFSPTGGTRQVADIVATNLSETYRTIDLTAATDTSLTLSEDDLAIIAFPSYGGRIPTPARRRLMQITAEGAMAVIVAVYGNREYEDTLIEMYDLCIQQGFRVVAAISAIAEHSVVREFAAGRPDATDRERLTLFAQEIKSKISAGDAMLHTDIPGNRPYKEFKSVSPTPLTDERCTKCGICVERCPVQAISDDCMTINAELCIRCGRCISICPQQSKYLPAQLLQHVSAMLTATGANHPKSPELFL